MNPIVEARVLGELFNGTQEARVGYTVKRRPLDFVFCAPSCESELELFNITKFVKSLGHDIKVVNGTLEDLGNMAEDFDFYMTAGNSYGHLTGGYDGALAERFPGIQKETAYVINSRYHGELNVGQCAPVPFQPASDKWAVLLYTPTMRVPRRLLKGNDIPYMATKAAFDYISLEGPHGQVGARDVNLASSDLIKDKPIRVLGCLMGTGTGNIPVKTAVAQFAIALYNYTYPRCVEKLFKDGQITDRAIRETWKPNAGDWQKVLMDTL